LNREIKRRMRREQRQAEKAQSRGRAPMPQPGQRRERVKVRQYIREIQGELKRVAWPSRPEVFTYAFVVVVIVTILTGIVFGLDFVFAKGVVELFRDVAPN